MWDQHLKFRICFLVQGCTQTCTYITRWMYNGKASSCSRRPTSIKKTSDRHTNHALKLAEKSICIQFVSSRNTTWNFKDDSCKPQKFTHDEPYSVRETSHAKLVSRLKLLKTQAGVYMQMLLWAEGPCGSGVPLEWNCLAHCFQMSDGKNCKIKLRNKVHWSKELI